MIRRFLPALALLLPVLLPADPSEKDTAWNDAPVGFHWDMLGPRTTEVALSDYTAVHHVSPAGSDESGDGSRARPWRSLRRALTAVPVTGRAAVLVAAGRHQEGTLTLQPRIDLYGGFDPAAWTRNIFLHPTILSGGGENRVLIGADDCRLDGFIVEDGVARDHGGALFCDAVSPAITNNVFRRNRTLEPAGFTHDASRRRQRGNDGGAVALVNAANADVRHNLFLGNETGVGYGGALNAAHDCTPIIAHNVFWGNRAGVTDRNKTLSGNGGAVGLLYSSRPAVFHNLFVANEALGGSDGGGLFMEYFCWPEVRHNAFLNNFAGDDGGALDNQKFSYPKLKANLFYGNRADGSGGAMHLDDSVIDLENNIFAYNRADKQGGGFGGTHGWYRALNNTIAFNEAGQDGGGLHIVNVKNPFLRPPVFRNNLFAHNQPEQALFEGEVDVTYNLMYPGGSRAGYYNRNHPPGFRDDSRKLTITAVQPDPAAFSTTLTIDGPVEEGRLAGRIVRIGTFWSMIRAATAGTMSVWGLLPADAGRELEIVQTFHLAPDSQSVNNGVYPDFPSEDIDGEPRYTPNIDLGADEYHAVRPGRN